MREEIRERLIDGGILPAREKIVEMMPLDELKTLDAKRKERNDIRGRLNIQEFNDEKRRAFLLGRMAKTAPPVESPKQMSTWRDEITTPAHQWDSSPVRERLQPWEK